MRLRGLRRPLQCVNDDENDDPRLLSWCVCLCWSPLPMLMPPPLFPSPVALSRCPLGLFRLPVLWVSWHACTSGGGGGYSCLFPSPMVPCLPCFGFEERRSSRTRDLQHLGIGSKTTLVSSRLYLTPSTPCASNRHHPISIHLVNFKHEISRALSFPPAASTVTSALLPFSHLGHLFSGLSE